nr:reverse transcriptase domain-containing protein [Tanacetum cinerariifolium]
MEELFQAPTEGYGEAIVILEINADHFEINKNLPQLVQANSYHGFERENPHTHINNFKRITLTLKFRDVPNDVIKLMMFPYSPEGSARVWYDKEPPNFILTWEDLVNKFVNQFFHPSKTTHLKNEISRLTQRFEETFGEACERFKEMLRACPHYGFTELAQIDTSHNGLNDNDQDSLNAVTGGNLLSETTREALQITENKSKVHYSRNKPNVSRMNTTSRENATVEESCGGAHAYYDCPHTDINQPSVCVATGIYIQVAPQNRASNYMAPPGFAPVQNSQNRNGCMSRLGRSRCDPTSTSEPILFDSSPSLTPFEGSDFILEEIEAYLKDESISLEINHADCDSEGGICLIEKLLNNDPFQLPSIDLKQGEVVKEKSSIKEPSDLELKDLPSHLEYAYLEDRFSSYIQIPINPPDQEKTTFTCPYGTFAYRRIPFGLCNAPGTFQRCMVAIFHDMIEKTMKVFMDDFSVFGDSFSSCRSHLDTMLQRCQDTNLVLNWEKSHFMVKEGIVLDHKIFKNGLEVDRAKVDVITKLPHPTTVKGDHRKLQLNELNELCDQTYENSLIYKEKTKKLHDSKIKNHIFNVDYDKFEVDHNDSEEKEHLVDKLIRKFNHKITKCQKRVEKANQQSKDLENQNKDLQEKYDVLINQVNTFEEQNNKFNEQIKVLNEKNDDLLAQTEVLQDQLKIKHVVINTHTECQAQYAKLEEEIYEYMIRYSTLCDNDKQHRKKIDEQEILFEKMSHQLVEMNNNVLKLQEKILEKETKILKFKGCVSNKDDEIEKCFENPSYFEKAKDLKPILYDEKVIGLGYTLMFLIHSDEALEIEKFKRARENKIEFAYDYGNLNASYVNEKIIFLDDYFQEIINPDFEKIDSPFQQTSSLKPYVPTMILEKIIIHLEDEVVSLLEKEKANLKTIESLKSKGCSKHMTGNCALLTIFMEKFLGTVRFGNNDFAMIAGYGDVVIGSMTIKKVYYVEGLGHNLFSVENFCDKGLEVAFRKYTCFIQNEDGVDLLTGDRSSNLYTITLNEVASNYLTYLLSKASFS